MMRTILYRSAMESLCLVIIACAVGLTVNGIRSERLAMFGTDCVEQFRVCSKTLQKADVVDVESAMALFYNKAAVFIDARSSIAYSMGHIHGAVNMPLGDAEQRYEDVLSGVSRDTFLVVYDDGVGGGDALALVSLLKTWAFPNVVVFPGGIKEWEMRGLPVDYGSSSSAFGR